MDRNYDVITFFSKNLYFKKAGVAIFADIIKVLTTFFKRILKDSGKVRIRSYESEWNVYLCFLIQQNLLISGKKMLISAKLNRCVT